MTDALDAYTSGSTEPWTASVLAAFVRISQPRRILELGTFEGRTTRELARAMGPEALLTTVENHIVRAENARRAFSDHPRVSVVASEALLFLNATSETFDFVFVDDSHEAEHVAAELDALIPKMPPGGIVIGHDVIGPFGLDEVFTSRGGFIVELPLLHVAGGLGVILT